MRKAFDANVPKLKPRLSRVAAAPESTEAVAEESLALALDPGTAETAVEVANPPTIAIAAPTPIANPPAPPPPTTTPPPTETLYVSTVPGRISMASMAGRVSSGGGPYAVHGRAFSAS